MSIFNDEEAHAIRYLADRAFEGLTRVSIALHRIGSSIDPIASSLDSIARDYHRSNFPLPPKPSPLTFRIKQEMAHQVKFDLQLPPPLKAPLPPGAADLEKGRLRVTRISDGSAISETTDLPLTKDADDNYSYTDLTADADGQFWSPEFVGDKDTDPTAEFVWVDDDGNESEHSATATVHLTDTERPPDAAGLGFRLKGEVPHA